MRAEPRIDASSTPIEADLILDVLNTDGVSVLVWTMVGIALWHFAVLVPDRFWGGIVGAFLAAVARRIGERIRISRARDLVGEPSGHRRGAVGDPRVARLGLALSYWYGSRRKDSTG